MHAEPRLRVAEHGPEPAVAGRTRNHSCVVAMISSAPTQIELAVGAKGSGAGLANARGATAARSGARAGTGCRRAHSKPLLRRCNDLVGTDADRASGRSEGERRWARE